MKIVFLAHKCIPIHAGSLGERPLGGTETGLIHIARELQAMGHAVTVFTSHPNPQVADPSSPRYLPLQALQSIQSCDVLVAVQDWWGLFQPIQAQKRIFWTGDAGDQFSTFGIGDRRVCEKVDRIIAVSEWHADNLSSTSGFPRERISVVGNGVFLPWFSTPKERQRTRLLYTSAPNRGLQLAVQYFQEVKKEFKDTELRIISGYKLYGRQNNPPWLIQLHQQFLQFRQEAEKIPGISFLENMTQENLSQEYLQAGIFFYPTQVPETFCITALEAQAAGCPPIVSDLGGLRETVSEDGFVVGGIPGSEEHRNGFLESARALLSDREQWSKLSESGRKKAFERCSWRARAEEMVRALAEMVRDL